MLKRIMGIDPGSRVTGVALIEQKKKFSNRMDNFCVKDVLTLLSPKSEQLSRRIGLFHNTMYDLLCEFKPDYVVMESSFVGKNPQSALKLGQVRGAFMCSVFRYGSVFQELAPKEVKKIVTGNGNASKECVQKSLKAFFKYQGHFSSYDASDALAVALAFAVTHGSFLETSKQKGLENGSFQALSQNQT